MSETAAEAGTPQVAPPSPACGPVGRICCPIQFVCGGDFCVDEVRDNNGAPATILEAALPFTVHGRILVRAGNAITGTATVTIYADQLGGPIDRAIGSVNVTITGDGTFNWTVTVPGGTLPDAPAGGSNLYRLAAVLTLKNSGGRPTETSSFVDLGTYRIS